MQSVEKEMRFLKILFIYKVSVHFIISILLIVGN